MKTLITIIFAQLILAASSFGVTWDVVTVSVTVKTGGGVIQTTVLKTNDYLDKVVNDNAGTVKSDLFVGIREDTGDLAVVRISDETVLYKIVFGLSAPGVASNATGTSRFLAGGATVSSLNTDFPGAFYEKQVRKPSLEVKSISRSWFGGSGGQTLKGSAHTTGRKVTL